MNLPPISTVTPPGAGSTPRAAAIQLAIETTGHTASLAILQGESTLASYFLDDRSRTASSLAPCVKVALEHCREQGWEVSFISIADGPGSFTGLRIGVTTAKTLAYAMRIPLVSVDSVAAVAARALCDWPECDSIAVALDAYRGQAFVGQFTRSEVLPPLEKIPTAWTAHPVCVRVAGGEELERFFQTEDDTVRFVGDAKVLGPRVDQSRELTARWNEHGQPQHVDAIGVGRLAIRSWIAGLEIDPMQLVPRYLRLSAAEEKLAAESVPRSQALPGNALSSSRLRLP